MRQFGAGSAPVRPLLYTYGYGPEYLTRDGICESPGDPPILRTEVCDNYISL